MHLYEKYIKERENKTYVGSDHYFFTYNIENGELYLANIYLDPDYRGTSLVAEIDAELVRIAKENDCRIITANIWLWDQGFHRTLKCSFKLGFKIISAQNNGVVIAKEIGGL